MRRKWWWLGVAGLFAAGCGGAAPGSNLPPVEQVQRSLALTQFKKDDCGSLQKYIADEAVLEMKSVLEMEKLQGPMVYEAGAADGPQTAGATPSAAGPSSYTTTNTQVAGVDEADFVKNDGTRIFVLSGQNLYAASSWPASALSIQSTLQIEGWPREMFLSGNTLAIFSNVYTAVPQPPPASPTAGASAMPVCMAGAGYDCAYWYGNTTKVTEVDVSDLANPKVTQQLYLPGYYAGSRMVGSSIRLVLSDNFVWPDGLSYWPQGNIDPSNKAAWVAAIDQLEQQNEQLIRAWPVEKWLPEGKRILADGSTVDVGYQCSDFSKSNAPTRLGILTVATVDLSQPEAAPSRTSTIAEVGTIYATPTSLYVASPHWWWWPTPGEQEWTYLYKFDLSDATKATFSAGGVIEGYVANQFSLDEKDGFLRAAVNLGKLVEDPNNIWGKWEQSNRIEVVKQQGSQLVQVGQSEEIAPDEWLEGARFLGDRAFLTTFQYVDPFFSFDLSDPTHPKRMGQLEVSGMSSYLQAIDDTHVLSIGIDVPPPQTTTTDGGTVSVWEPQNEPLQLTLFDVSDLSHPTVTAKTEVGDGYAWSSAMWDHHAFNWYPEKKLLAVPFTDWSWSGTDYWSSFVSDLRVFSVDPATGITPKGALSMSDVFEYFNDYDWSYVWSPDITRSIMADNYVYAISDAGIRVADVNALSQPIATVQFNPPPTTTP